MAEENPYSVDGYVEAFSDKVLAGLPKEAIRGEDILRMTSILQINYHVLWQIYRKWRVQNRRLRLPYFDYHHAEVEVAMKEAMRVLSLHILVPKSHMLPLLKRAVYATLCLVFFPYDAYRRAIAGEGEAFPPSYLEEMKKYFKINANLLQLLIDRCQGAAEKSLAPHAWEQKLEEVRREAPPLEASAHFLGLFDETHPLNREILKASRLTFSEERAAPSASRERFPWEGGVLSKKEKAIEQMDDAFRRDVTRDLFNNSEEAFHTAMHQALSQKNFDHSVEFLVRNYARKNRWNLDRANVKQLFKLLFKAF